MVAGHYQSNAVYTPQDSTLNPPARSDRHLRVGSRLRRLAALGLMLAGATQTLHSQSLFDPNDRIYHHLTIWEQRGYFFPLPELRPYAPQLVAELLRQVAEKGDRRDRELAAAYLQELSPHPPGDAPAVPPIHVGIRADVSSSPEPGTRTRLTGELESHYVTNSLFAYSGAISYWWQEGADQRLMYTVPHVPARPLILYGRDVGASDLHAAAALGVAGLHLQAGFVQHAFGPAFADSLVLGAQAPPAAQLSGVYRGDRFSYTVAFLELMAERAVTRTGIRYRLKYGCLESVGCPHFRGFPSKYVMLHALQWYPLPWLSVSAFSTWLFGARLSLHQLLPTAPLTERFTGDYDNGLTGGSLRLRLPAGLGAFVTLFVDDYHPINRDGSISLFTNKMAGQAAISWAPPGLAGMVSIDYTFIAPYTYTHSSFQPINYLTYTHHGQPLGSALPPNSDQLSLAAIITPVTWLDLELAARVIRHGGGSIWDDGYDESGSATFVGGAPDFLDPVTESVYQLEAAVTSRAPIGVLQLATRLNYGLEFIESTRTTNHLIGASLGLRL